MQEFNERSHRCATVQLHIEFHLKIGLIPIYLERSHGDYSGAVERADEFCPADAKFTAPRFDFVVLHSARFVGHSTVDPVTLHGNRGGDVAHLA